ncbi:fimbria/pilus outer membrane usher protein [Aquitalea aquatica]|uniref:Fimbrial biogenesis outer membrane usher protein n=1 Tax=Aquitalea aquatica TaxID=3044273 RepID=A0A838Y5I0_9NEIS|nr:fimbria/pilus outer membrane usher protein [Aquitalea magnusonii]MBA4707807.1 fimbrial biogenesis outer membrane usher protein [Aquitalea magnusonii]
MKSTTPFNRNPTYLIIVAILASMSRSVQAEDNTAAPAFDKSMLWGQSLKNLDFSKYNTTNTLPDGTYSIDLSINGIVKGRRDLTVIKKPNTNKAIPCLSRKLLLEFGVKPESLAAATENSEDECVDLANRIKDAFYEFNSNDLQLNISVPQIDMSQQLQGYVPPERWESGLPAFLLDYNSNFYYAKNSGDTAQNAYFLAKTGVNIGNWQFRNTTTASWNNTSGRSITPIESYLKRDIDSIKSQLIIGDNFTDGDLFDSVSLRGIRLVSDERMKPINDTGYAPIVRGIANSNAKVTIKQNGYIIAETTVAPGAFEIKDIAPSSYNGDLQVTVTEADGRSSTFAVPFSAVPRSLRQGSDRYSFSFGKVRQLANSQPWLGQLTYQRGLSNLLTMNSGLTASDGYTALQLGTVFNTGAGAVGLDMTTSNTNLGSQSLTGQSYRISFNKLFYNTGTNVTLAAYRYSTSGYLSIQDALNARDKIASYSNSQGFIDGYARVRSRAEININQTFGTSSSAYISGSTQTYWAGQGSNSQFQAGVRQGYRWGNIGVNTGRQTDFSGRSINTVMFTVNFNLDKGKTFSTSFQHDSSGNNSNQMNVNGTLGEERKLSYGINVINNKNQQSESNNISGNLSYQGSNGIISTSASTGNHSSQMSLGLSGSVVGAAGTILFGQPLGDSTAIIQAADAEGAQVTPSIGVKINADGYALLPSLSSYRLNSVLLETGSMSDGVELDYTSTEVVPRSGSVVLAKFKTKKGIPLLFKTSFPNGQPLPFGASVYDKDENIVGEIGQSGKLFARVKYESGQLVVKYTDNRTCDLIYDMKKQKKDEITAIECTVANAGK